MKPSTDDSKMRAAIHRSWRYTLGLAAASLVLLAVLASTFNPSKSLAAIQHVHWPTVLIVLCLAFGNYIFRVIRFRYQLSLFNFRLPIAKLFPIYVAGFAMSATPGKFGEFLRMWLLKLRYGLPYQSSLPVFAGDRGTDVLATSLLCLATVFVFAQYWLPSLILGLVFGAGAVLLARPVLLLALLGLLYRLTGWKPRLFARIRRVMRSTACLFAPGPLFIGTLLGCAGWLLECTGLYVAASVFHPITIFQAIFIFTFANLVGAVSLIPGGVVGTEVSLTTMLAAVGLGVDEAVAVTAVIRGATLWFGILCGYIALGFCFWWWIPQSIRMPTSAE